MKLLVLTQAIDTDDPALGFFHSWVAELSRHFSSIVVVCLKEGAHALPSNVRVLSLGKERSASRAMYLLRLFSYAWNERKGYDAVFVHQNQEYVLLVGLLWKSLGKQIFMWRNHYAGSILTSIAGMFCAKVFYTSKHSYTARLSNAVQMPVGVDTDVFKPGGDRAPRSILFLGRIAPSKHPDVLVEALGLLHTRGVDFTASLYGPTLPKDESYRAALSRRIRELGLASKVSLHEGVQHSETSRLYASHEVFVNLSESGMYDKTLFEAAASGCIVVSRSDDFAHAFSECFTFDGSAESLADALEEGIRMPAAEGEEVFRALRAVAESNSLRALGDRLAEEIV